MTITTTDLAAQATTSDLQGVPSGVHPGRWPLYGILAGVASLVTPVLNAPFVRDTAVYAAGPEAVFAELTGARLTQVGAFVGYATCGLLIAFAIGLVRTMQRRAPRARDLVLGLGIALTAGVTTLAGGSMWKSVLASGLPGGIDAAYYSQVDVAVINTIEQQMIYAAFVPFVAVMAITAALVLKHGVLPRWTGLLSAFFAGAVSLVTLALNLPWSSGLVTPLWLIALSVAVLRLRRREA